MMSRPMSSRFLRQLTITFETTIRTRSLTTLRYVKQESTRISGTRYRSISSTSSSLWKVAIVGSGPSGCYTAKYLQSSLKKKYDVHPTIDIIDRLPTPYGLVRYGVAPDHPEVKNVQNDFDQLFVATDEKNNHQIQFYGNVHVGFDVSISELRKLYDIIVLAYGCESDRKLGIPGESFDGVLSAREFVAWYNGHPDFVHIGEKVAEALGIEVDGDRSVRNVPVVVIGQGNVALDCARILAKGSKGLFDTDLASHALNVLGDGTSDISIIGRRGHVQGAFTIKELRELVKLEEDGYETAFVVRNDELDLGLTNATKEELTSAQGRPKTRIDTLLRQAADAKPNTSLAKRIHLRFLLNPTKFEPADNNPQAVGSVVCERTFLQGEAGNQKAIGTGEYETLSAKLVLVSIGYKPLVLPEFGGFFDHNGGTIKNIRGKVDASTSNYGGIYTSGWLKRGPSGIIGTNIVDAKDTVQTILKDIEDKTLCTHTSIESNGSLQDLLEQKGIQYVDWNGYRRIVEKENDIRRSDKQPREKITSIKEMIRITTS